MDEPAADPIEIPHNEISAPALRSLVEAFVLREGTDYGDADHTLADKVTQVMRQLARREARIVFDPATESVDIVVVGRQASRRDG